MSAWLCCRRRDMGQALHHPSQQVSDARDGSGNAPLTMAEVIRERKKRAGMAGLSTLRRRLAQVTRRNNTGDDWSHARYIRSVVHSWKTAEVCALHQELEAGAVLRDLCIQADLARAPAPTLRAALRSALRHRWCADVELECDGVIVPAHRALLCARSHYFRALLHDHWSENRVKLEGLPTPITLQQLNAVLLTIYQGSSDSGECICERRDSDLDIISTDRPSGCGGTNCSSGIAPLSALGVSTTDPQHDCRYLLDSGEYSDCRLVFWAENNADPSMSTEYSPTLYLRAHKLMLAARSRMFRSVLTRGGSDICVDEGVLPQRFAAALLHATYTDQIDLNLIGRNSNSPNNTGNKNSTSRTQTQLEDAFQLYEIARFLEMSIVSQGCEDVIVSRLDPDTLPTVLRWVTHPSSSPYVRRQAYRYLLDEFPRIMQSPSSAQLTSTSIAEALRSPYLQCSETQALKALLKWGETQSNADQLTSLASLIRVEHIHGDNSVLQQAIRRGIIQTPPAQMLEPHCSASAWLGRGPHRPARILLPYLEEIKALLESQNIPAAEVARVRRSRYLHKIPDTLYMVNASPAPDSISSTIDASAQAAWSCLTPSEIHHLKTRTQELYSTNIQTPELLTQICLRAVRERGLPDMCARVLSREMFGERRNDDAWQPHTDDSDDDCRLTDENARSLSASSLRPQSGADNRSTTCRRDTPDSQRDRARAGTQRPRLSSAVPDVAMGPNANTHLLTVRDYHHNFGATVLQLDLGDGATHAPPPGSRAQRAARQNRNEMMLRPTSAGNGDMRNAIEMSLRVYPHAASPRSIPPLPTGSRCSHDNFANLIQDRNLQLFDRNNCFNGLNCRTNDPIVAHINNDDLCRPNEPQHVPQRNNDISHRSNAKDPIRISHRNNDLSRNTEGLCRAADPLHMTHRNNEVDINCHTLERRHLPHRNEGAIPNLTLRCNEDRMLGNDRNNHLSLLTDRNIQRAQRSTHAPDVSDRNNCLSERNTPINERNYLTDRNMQVCHRNSETPDRNTPTSDKNIYLSERNVLRHKNSDTSERNTPISDKNNFLSDRNLHQRTHRNSPDRSERINARSSGTPDRNTPITDRSILSERITPVNDRNYLSDRNIHARSSPDRSLLLSDVNLQLSNRTPERHSRNNFTIEIHQKHTKNLDRKCHTLDRHTSFSERAVVGQRNSDGCERNSRTPDGNTTMGDISSYLTLRNNSCERRVLNTDRCQTIERNTQLVPAVHVRGHFAVHAGGHVSRESLRRTPSPRHLKRHEYFRPPPDFRHDPSYGNSSRGHSPNYA